MNTPFNLADALPGTGNLSRYAPLPNPLLTPAMHTAEELWMELNLNQGMNDATVRAVLMAAQRNNQTREHTGLALSIILAQQLAETRARLVRAMGERPRF